VVENWYSKIACPGILIGGRYDFALLENEIIRIFEIQSGDLADDR